MAAAICRRRLLKLALLHMVREKENTVFDHSFKEDWLEENLIYMMSCGRTIENIFSVTSGWIPNASIIYAISSKTKYLKRTLALERQYVFEGKSFGYFIKANFLHQPVLVFLQHFVVQCWVFSYFLTQHFILKYRSRHFL